MISKAQIKAVNKYVAKSYDRFSLILPHGFKAELRTIASAQGKSLNQYIIDAIDAYKNQE